MIDPDLENQFGFSNTINKFENPFGAHQDYHTKQTFSK